MKVNINNLPEGYKIVNGKVVKTMALGGVPRTQANLEAEKGETALTDLDNDGVHELYTIGGERHHSGGTPLNLPEQSFIFSDTSKMKFDKNELAELGLESKKKQTPAWASKKFQLNEFITNQAEEHSDHITDKTSELMLEKNKLQLSKVAFMQEAKKDFTDEEGNITVPLAAYPFLISKGIHPEEFIAKLEEIKAAKEGVQQAPMQGQEERGQTMQQPAPQLQDFTGPPQGMSAQGPPPGGMPPQGMMPPQQMMAKYGGNLQQGGQGGGQEMKQIVQSIGQAIEQGAQPEEVIANLLQNQVPPNVVMQVFGQLGMPLEQAEQMIMVVMQQVQGGQQQMTAQQGPPMHQMPDGSMMLDSAMRHGGQPCAPGMKCGGALQSYQGDDGSSETLSISSMANAVKTKDLFDLAKKTYNKTSNWYKDNDLDLFVYGGDLHELQDGGDNPAHGQPGHRHQEGEAEFGHGTAGNPSVQCYIDENGNEICDQHEVATNLSGAFSSMTNSEDFDIARNVWIDRYNTDAAEAGSNYVKSDDPEALYDNFYRYNEFLQQVQSHGLEMPEKETSGTNCGGKRCDGVTFRNGKTFADISKELGYEDLFFEADGVTPTKNPTKMFQGMYRSMGNLKNEGDESTKGLFNNFTYSPQGGGWGDDSEHRLGDLNVSTVDGVAGTTTYGQYLGVDDHTPEPVNDCENRAERMQECGQRNTMQGGVQTTDGITTNGALEGAGVKWFWNDANCACEQGPGDFTPPDLQEPKPWLQDQNNLNQAIMNKGMREDFFPMQQSFNYNDADMISHDPLASIHGSNALAGSMSGNATTSAAEKAMLFDKAAGANRQAIQDTHNADITAYNALSRYNATNRGQVDNLNMQAKDQYVDEVNTVLHNRINTDIADNENINKMNNNLITNMATTFNQNALYPNYNIDPTTGGIINFANAKAYQDEINPSSGSTSDAWLGEYKNLRDGNPDITHEEAIDILNKNTTASSKAKEKNRPAGYPTQTGTTTGATGKYGTETIGARREDLLRSRRELRKWILGIQ